MTESEAIKKAIRHFECMKNDAVVVLDSGFGTHPGESDLVYRNRKMYAELAINALEKQIPKKPKSTHIKYGKHTWAKKENGEIDDFAWDYEYHNGVVCEVCGKTVCVHCNPQYDRLTDCEDEYYNCPSCGKKIFSAYKYCDCGQKIDWSDEE